MVGFKSVKDVEKVIESLKTKGKRNGEKFIHVSDHIEITYEDNDGEIMHIEDAEE